MVRELKKKIKIRELFYGWDIIKENYFIKYIGILLGRKDVLVV